jgi:hypothetical protein
MIIKNVEVSIFRYILFEAQYKFNFKSEIGNKSIECVYV